MEDEFALSSQLRALFEGVSNKLREYIGVARILILEAGLGDRGFC